MFLENVRIEKEEVHEGCTYSGNLGPQPYNYKIFKICYGTQIEHGSFKLTMLETLLKNQQIIFHNDNKEIIGVLDSSIRKYTYPQYYFNSPEEIRNGYYNVITKNYIGFEFWIKVLQEKFLGDNQPIYARYNTSTR